MVLDKVEMILSDEKANDEGIKMKKAKRNKCMFNIF